MPGPAGDLHQNVRGVSQHPATIHQRILQRLRESIMRAIIGIGFAEAEQATAVGLRSAASKSSKPIRISPGRWIRFTIERTLWLIMISAAANA